MYAPRVTSDGVLGCLLIGNEEHQLAVLDEDPKVVARGLGRDVQLERALPDVKDQERRVLDGERDLPSPESFEKLISVVSHGVTAWLGTTTASGLLVKLGGSRASSRSSRSA